MSSFRFFLLTLICLAAGCGESDLPYQNKEVSELVEMLRSSDVNQQTQGAFGLAMLKEKAQPAIPALLKALKSPDAEVRRLVILALGKTKTDDPKVVQTLIMIVSRQQNKFEIRRQAALALGELGEVSRPAIPVLKKVQADPLNDHLVQEAAQKALSQIQK